MAEQNQEDPVRRSQLKSILKAVVEQDQEGPVRRNTDRIDVQHVLEFVISVQHSIFVDIKPFRGFCQVEISLDEGSHSLDELFAVLPLQLAAVLEENPVQLLSGQDRVKIFLCVIIKKPHSVLSG